MCIRLKAHLPLGRARHWLMIKWSSGQRQKCVSTQTPYYVWRRCGLKEAKTRWEGQVEEFKMSVSYKDLVGPDGEPTEFEWSILPGLTSLKILQKIQNDLRERNIEPEKFTDRIIFMSMSNGIDWTRCEEILAGTLDVPRSWR